MSDRPDSYLLYGETDTGKTVQLGEAAKWHYERTGEISRLISADSGWDPIEELILTPENPGGIIEAWNVQALRDPWSPLRAASLGEWPSVEMSTDGRWKRRMQKPTLKDGRIVSKCGKLVGQYLIEGISTLGNTGLQDHILSQRVLGQDVVGKFVSSFEELDEAGKTTVKSETFAKAAPSHYGQVQDFILLDLVPGFGRCPCARVIWTGHEAKGTDEITGVQNSVLGPATVGKATVDRTVQKFGHALHMTVETVFAGDRLKPTISRDFRAWFVKHPDVVLTKMSWPCKVSLSIARSKELLRRFPGGYIPLTGGSIGQYLEFVDEATRPREAQGITK